MFGYYILTEKNLARADVLDRSQNLARDIHDRICKFAENWENSWKLTCLLPTFLFLTHSDFALQSRQKQE